MTANSLQFNKFEIKSNVDGKTVDLRAGASIIEYRESVFMPHLEITAFINDTGNTDFRENFRSFKLEDFFKENNGENKVRFASKYIEISASYYFDDTIPDWVIEIKEFFKVQK